MRARCTPAGAGVNRGVRAGDRYALFVDGAGPVLDPYAREVDATGAGVVVGPLPPLAPGPGRPWEDTVLYEAHVKGLTACHPDVAAARRGTFAGLTHPAVLDHLLALGVTAVELLPVAYRRTEPAVEARGLTNYWGYAPAAFLAPDPRFASSAHPLVEFRSMVAALHAAGLEVIVDVVYNHAAPQTAEAWRLLDPTYFRERDVTGTGNTLDLREPFVATLVADSLRWWVQALGVDGFRFDLATTLTRETSFLQILAQDPVLSAVKLIAEPWDLGEAGYRLGGFGHPWAEWNDRFRDTVRRFWRGDPGQLPDLATRLTGSADVFSRPVRGVWSSVNHVTSHDGFTMADLVAYRHKHNEANAEHNRDGHDANFSWNHGVEGCSGHPAVLAARARDVRNLLATLLLAAGTPMLTAGDELGRTQRGNNNAYCQDNEISWLAWERADTELAAFVAALIAIRRDERSLREGGRVVWRRPDGAAMAEGDWLDAECRCVAMVADDRVAVLLNASNAAVSFALEGTWERRLATAAAEGAATPARSLAVLLRPGPESAS